MNKFCGNCGEKLINNAEFCGQCGVKMNNLSKPIKDDFIKKEVTIENDVKSKSKGRNIYSIIGVLIFILIFGSRAIWTSYKEQKIYELSVPVDYNDVRKLFIDKNWKLMSYSNFTSNSDLPSIEKSVKSSFNNLINDDEAYMRYTYSSECEIDSYDDMFLFYDVSWDEQFGENMYSVMLYKLTNESEGATLYSEGNSFYSIGVDSQIEDVFEADFKIKNVIVDINKSSLEIHQYVEFDFNEVAFSYDVYFVYEAIEDDNESNMVNANYKKALEWDLYDCENFIIFPPSPPEPND